MDTTGIPLLSTVKPSTLWAAVVTVAVLIIGFMLIRKQKHMHADVVVTNTLAPTQSPTGSPVETPVVSTQANIKTVGVSTTAPLQPAATVATTKSTPLQLLPSQQTLTYTDLFDAYTLVNPGDGRFDVLDLSVPTSTLGTNVLDEAVAANDALGVMYVGNVYKLIVPGRFPKARFDSTAQMDPGTIKSWWKATPVPWGTPGAAYLKKRRTQLVDVPTTKTLPSLPLNNIPLSPVVSMSPLAATPVMPAADPTAPTQRMSDNDFQEYLAATAILVSSNTKADATSKTWATHVLAALKDYSLTDAQKATLASGKY